MKQELETRIAAAVQSLFGVKINVALTRPDEKFGDFATNAPLQIAKRVDKSPREIAQSLADELSGKLSSQVQDISIAGPGFLNFLLQDKALIISSQIAPKAPLEGQVIVAEYSDPNPFKVLHAGHLYTSLVGDAVSRLMEQGGATVYRVNFGGDVGLHVGKTMWAIIKKLGGENFEKLNTIEDKVKLDWISQCYVEGNAAYDTDAQAKEEITIINKRVYKVHAEKDHESSFAQIYWTCRQWSYDGFDNLYKRLDMLPFEKYYPESTVADLGFQKVKEHTGKVYEESDGAVVFKGEPFGLFTQVFINGEGLPTYAGKDVGLIYKKHEDFKPSRSFIFTDIAQKDHLAVVMESVKQYAPELVDATIHYTHGQIKMAGGVKMSSRAGNILKADDILESAGSASRQLVEKDNPVVVLAAVKYAFLKNRIGSDIVYDPKESVSLEGNSGPYLQYAHARARSILSKSDTTNVNLEATDGLETGERTLVRKISEYGEVVDAAVAELLPHHICTYLYELAQQFNRFYEHNRVLGEERETLRLGLVRLYADTLRTGLSILGIASPDKM